MPSPRLAQRLQYSVSSRGSCSSSVMFPYRGKLLHVETSAAFPSVSGPLFPPGSRDVPLSSWGHSSHHERSSASTHDARRRRHAERGYGEENRYGRLSEHQDAV